MKNNKLSVLFILTLLPFFVNGQTKLKKMFIANAKGTNLISSDQFIYELEDSTISFVSYDDIDFFYKKTPTELTEIDAMIQSGDLDVEVQKISVDWIDQIKVSPRKARMRNTFIGLGLGTVVGMVATITYYNRDRDFDPETDSVDFNGILIGGGITGLGAIIGAALQTTRLKVRIGRNKSAYQKKYKKQLEQYAILK